jgi:sugar/nucleoside kinase (ribokinase family)
LEHTRAVTLGSIFRAPFDDPEVIHAVLQSARQRGALVFADTKLPNFRKLSLEDIAESLPLIDFLTPNEDEARYFTGEEDPAKMADRFLDKGVRHVIIKLGERGCLFRSRDAATALPAFDVQVVDATGAGDNFLAGFVSELLRGNQVREALTFANACGAICCTKLGAATALRNREQVERFRLTMATKPAAMTDV